jgi:hypothetical protein
MPWRGPESEGDFPSLGWELLEWWTKLPSPRDPKESLIFTDEQAWQLIEWYAIDPETNRFVYRRGYSRRSKGWGKSPVEAAKAIAELCGPVRFDGWDAKGEPVGRPWGEKNDPLPWVQIAAISEDQTDNTWSVVHYLLTENDGKAADDLKVDAGLTRCFLRNRPGAKLEPVTAAAGSREGQPITYGVIDESHLMTPRNGGVRLARTLRRNVAKMGGRSYETTNAYVPGESSVAEGSYRAVRAGAPGIFANEVEAPRVLDGVKITPEASDELIERGLRIAYGDSWWIDTRRLVAEIRDPETTWDDSCRFFFNWNTQAGGSVVDSHRWGQLGVERHVEPGERIALGFDGSISDDSTFLIGCTADGFLFVLGAWERPRFDDGRPVKDWRVPRLEVGTAVRAAFETYNVGRMFGDPPKWATELESWADEFRQTGSTEEERERVLAFDTNQHARFAKCVDRFRTALAEGTLSHAGDARLTAHVEAARLKKVRVHADEDDQRTMYVIIKPEDGRKIDAAVAAVLAHEAAMTMPAEETKPLMPLGMWR